MESPPPPLCFGERGLGETSRRALQSQGGWVLDKAHPVTSVPLQP